MLVLEVVSRLLFTQGLGFETPCGGNDIVRAVGCLLGVELFFKRGA
jgi:hypothetical protein